VRRVLLGAGAAEAVHVAGEAGSGATGAGVRSERGCCWGAGHGGQGGVQGPTTTPTHADPTDGDGEGLGWVRLGLGLGLGMGMDGTGMG